MDALPDIVGPENIAVALPAGDRHEVLLRLIDLLPIGDPKLKRAIYESVLEREAIQTTGIGYGIAIPHGRAAIEPPLLAAIGVTAEPVDYDSVDGSPARIFILLVSRTDVVGPHVKALAHVARLLGRADFRQALLDAREPEEVLRILRDGVKA